MADNYKELRKALDEAEELELRVKYETGALSKVVKASDAAVAKAQNVLDAAVAEAQAAYDKVESEARSIRDGLLGQRHSEFQAVQNAQNEKLADAHAALQQAEDKLKYAQERIQNEWGIAPAVAAANTTIRVG